MEERHWKYADTRVELTREHRFNTWSVRVYQYGQYKPQLSRHGILSDAQALAVYGAKVQSVASDT